MSTIEKKELDTRNDEITMIPQHLSITNEHYTPLFIIDRVRLVFGGHIDTDPASTDFINRERVKAINYFSIEDNGLNQKWHGNVFLNPPGGKINNKSSQSIWLDTANRKYREGEITSFIFVAFNMEILRISAKVLTNQWVCVPYQRIAYDIYLEASQRYHQKKSPPHTSFLIYFGHNPNLFKQAFDEVGTIWQLIS